VIKFAAHVFIKNSLDLWRRKTILRKMAFQPPVLRASKLIKIIAKNDFCTPIKHKFPALPLDEV